MDFIVKPQITGLISKGFWMAMDWIYPPVCASCGEPGFRLCEVCRVKISFIQDNCCPICGEPAQTAKRICESCLLHPPPYTAMRNLAKYEGVIRDCVHALKYQNNQALGDYFAGDLADLVIKNNWKIDLVVPVPLSLKREVERGYNQASCLAKPLANRVGLRFHPYGLERTRETPSQVGLTGDERRKNVLGAFNAFPELVTGKSILIVDDVMTTGATLFACVHALKSAGANDVFCLTLGRFALRGDDPIYPGIKYNLTNLP